MKFAFEADLVAPQIQLLQPRIELERVRVDCRDVVLGQIDDF